MNDLTLGMWDVAQGQENSNGVFSSHAGRVFGQETCELGGVLLVVFCCRLVVLVLCVYTKIR